MANSYDHARRPVPNVGKREEAHKSFLWSAGVPPLSLRWQSALFRKLDWSVWGLIYRSGMNTWMRSSAIFHTHTAPTLGWNIITAGPESGGGNRFSPEQALRCHVAHYSQYLTRCEIFSALTSDFCWRRAVSPPAPHGRWTLEGETVSWVSTES